MTTINYNGQELECITEGYWPKGVTMVTCDVIGQKPVTHQKVVCLRNGHVFYIDGACSCHWQYWAILPPNTTPRKLTNREIYRMWRNGWDYKSNAEIVCDPAYHVSFEEDNGKANGKLRAPGSDEWVEPTSDLLEK